MHAGITIILWVIALAIFYTGVAILTSWLFQRKSAIHPVRNGIISAAIPGVAFILYGIIVDCPWLWGNPPRHYSGCLLAFLVVLTGVLFVMTCLPACIILCKKLARKNQAKETQA